MNEVREVLVKSTDASRMLPAWINRRLYPGTYPQGHISNIFCLPARAKPNKDVWEIKS